MEVSKLEGAELDYWVARAEGWTTGMVRGRGVVRGLGVFKPVIAGLWPMLLRSTHDEWVKECESYPWFNGQEVWEPSRNWAQAGPIIERAEIMICPRAHDGVIGELEGWYANVFYDGGEEYTTETCSTPLIAAMRCYVASKFGDHVPDEK